MRSRDGIFHAYIGDFGNFTSRHAIAVYYLWRHITFTDLIITTLIMNDFLVERFTEHYYNINTPRNSRPKFATEMMLIAYIANVVLLIVARIHIGR